MRLGLFTPLAAAIITDIVLFTVAAAQSRAEQPGGRAAAAADAGMENLPARCLQEHHEAVKQLCPSGPHLKDVALFESRQLISEWLCFDFLVHFCWFCQQSLSGCDIYLLLMETTVWDQQGESKRLAVCDVADLRR